MQTIIDAITAAVPAGYACSCADVERIELARIDGVGQALECLGVGAAPTWFTSSLLALATPPAWSVGFAGGYQAALQLSPQLSALMPHASRSAPGSGSTLASSK